MGFDRPSRPEPTSGTLDHDQTISIQYILSSKECYKSWHHPYTIPIIIFIFIYRSRVYLYKLINSTVIFKSYS